MSAAIRSCRPRGGGTHRTSCTVWPLSGSSSHLLRFLIVVALKSTVDAATWTYKAGESSQVLPASFMILAVQLLTLPNNGWGLQACYSDPGHAVRIDEIPRIFSFGGSITLISVR